MTEDDDLERFAVKHGFEGQADLVDTLRRLGSGDWMDREKVEASGRMWARVVINQAGIRFTSIPGYPRNVVLITEDPRNVARIMKAACPSSRRHLQRAYR